MSKVRAETRRELVQALGERYRTVGLQEIRRILDEFVALTGYHRKHAIRALNGDDAASTSFKCGRRRLYDDAVREMLIVLWEASDRICGKRLKPLLPVLLPALERHGHVQLDPAVRERIMAVSAATIDRLLIGARAIRGGRPCGPLRREHGGSFAHTLVLTDIASGWTECIALLVREGSLIVDALERLHVTLPVPLRGIDTDNGSEFINDTLVTLPATRDRIHALARLLASSDWVDSGLVFTSTTGTPLDERNVRRAFKSVLRSARLPGCASTTFATLRRHCCSRRESIRES
jgi:hypothetical protein